MKFRQNIKEILKKWLCFGSSLGTLVTLVLTFVSWEELNINEPYIKILILLTIILLSFVASIIVTIFTKSKRIWKRGKSEIKVMYGNIFDLEAKGNKKKIVVIPVNDTFETIVEEPGEGVIHPLVSNNTLHGKFIEYFKNYLDVSADELNERIKCELNCRYKDIEVKEKPIDRGNYLSYPIGTVVAVNGEKNTIFYLLVISKFDNDNVAQSDKYCINDALNKLLEFYNINGQGLPMYIPLIGTGKSRAELTHKQSLNIIKNNLIVNEKLINGEINIVIYKDDAHNVTIYD